MTRFFGRSLCSENAMPLSDPFLGLPDLFFWAPAFTFKEKDGGHWKRIAAPRNSGEGPWAIPDHWVWIPAENTELPPPSACCAVRPKTRHVALVAAVISARNREQDRKAAAEERQIFYVY